MLYDNSLLDVIFLSKNVADIPRSKCFEALIKDIELGLNIDLVVVLICRHRVQRRK